MQIPLLWLSVAVIFDSAFIKLLGLKNCEIVQCFNILGPTPSIPVALLKSNVISVSQEKLWGRGQMKNMGLIYI